MKKVRKGFTLVELLIVIAVLGVLTAMMQLSGTGATASASAAKIISSLHVWRTAVAMYVAECAGGTPDVTVFEANKANYVDVELLGAKVTDYKFAAGTAEADKDKWFVTYTLPTANATKIQAKLAERAETENLLAGAATGTKYTSGNTVSMRVY